MAKELGQEERMLGYRLFVKPEGKVLHNEGLRENFK